MKSFSLACLLCLGTAFIPLRVESKIPADYPLRIHIFSPSETNFYQSRRIYESKGEGRANLCERRRPGCRLQLRLLAEAEGIVRL